jgi:lysophospholipase L1-like esterase
MQRLRLLLLALSILPASTFAQPIRTLRWAVIGDAAANWSVRAGIRLPADSMFTFKVDGGTALRSGDSSYWTSGKLAEVFAYQPDIVSIQLGSADSKAVNWVDSARFAADYKALIDTLASMPSKPRILVVYPTPVMVDSTVTNPSARSNRVMANSIIPRLRAIAQEKGADTVDLHTPLAGREDRYLTPGNQANRVLPNTVGQDTLGRLVFEAFVRQSIRIMCVGNSITQAAGTTGNLTAKDAYPISLNKLLGKKYWVWNGGKSGWWMQRAQLPGASSSFKSYVTDKAQMDTLFMMKPHYITVKLGTNDSRKYFWNGARFVNDYRYFIDTLYNNMNPKPKFILFKAFPAWKVGNPANWAFPNSGWTADTSGISGDIIRDSLGPSINVIAASRTTQVVGIVDLYTPFAAPTQNTTFSTDGVHPNKAGQDSIAHIVYKSIFPIVTALKPDLASRMAPAQPAARAIRFTARPTVAPRGLRSLDGKASGSRPGAGVYVKPSPKKAAGKK